MATARLSSKRAKLLVELEYLIGNNCYNGNIQNWGPGGSFEGEGRYFRYPLTTVSADDAKRKHSHRADGSDPDTLATGYYAFGANKLKIIEGLNEVLSYLEKNHGLKL